MAQQLPTHWVHDLDPVMFRIGPLQIRYYGMAYLLAFVLSYLLLRLAWRRGRSPLDPDKLESAMVALAIGVLGGGRLGYVILYAWPEFVHDPLMIFRLWEGGMASHGGFIGVALALAWVAHRYRLSFLRLGDELCAIAPLGLLLGRLANFINGELWGKVSSVPWAVIFPKSEPPGTPLAAIAPRHPSQLYEAALEGALLLAWSQWRFWRTGALRRPGRLAGEFLILYAVVRIAGEQFREPDAGLILGLSRGIFYSLFLIVAGAVVIAISARRPPLPLPGEQAGAAPQKAAPEADGAPQPDGTTKPKRKRRR